MRRRMAYRETPVSPIRMQLRAAVDEFFTQAELGVPKGHCPKCKRHIGRGIHRHVKACRG